MLGVVEVRGCACWWWLIFELVLMAKAKATAKTCWGCSPYPSVTFAHDCEGANFRARAGRAAENGTCEANGKSKVQTCILRPTARADLGASGVERAITREINSENIAKLQP